MNTLNLEQLDMVSGADGFTDAERQQFLVGAIKLAKRTGCTLEQLLEEFGKDLTPELREKIIALWNQV